MTAKEQIINKTFELLNQKPEGIRYSVLIKTLKEHFPQTPDGTIHGSIWNLDTKMPEKIYKPVKGLFKLKEFDDSFQKNENDNLNNDIVIKNGKTIKEQDFYEPFADWLVNDNDIIKFPIEITSVDNKKPNTADKQHTIFFALLLARKKCGL
jgi:hypothetical protein